MKDETFKRLGWSASRFKERAARNEMEGFRLGVSSDIRGEISNIKFT